LSEPVWVELAVVLAIHFEQLAAFGGAPGIRDQNGIESALAPLRHLHAYGKPDIFELAAAYTAGLCRNHGFADGNKCTAFLVGYVFLASNGYTISAEQSEVVAAMLALADHGISEDGYAQWLREHAEAG
jgi:death-on-curing protein